MPRTAQLKKAHTRTKLAPLPLKNHSYAGDMEALGDLFDLIRQAQALTPLIFACGPLNLRGVSGNSTDVELIASEWAETLPEFIAESQRAMTTDARVRAGHELPDHGASLCAGVAIGALAGYLLGLVAGVHVDVHSILNEARR